MHYNHYHYYTSFIYCLSLLEWKPIQCERLSLRPIHLSIPVSAWAPRFGSRQG